MDTNKRLGDNLRYYRKQQGLTLKEMSDKLDISLGTYQKYETAQIKHIDIDMVVQFAKALNVPPAVLLNWEEEDNVKAKNLFQKYEAAIPEIQDAVESLLKSSRHDP